MASSKGARQRGRPKQLADMSVPAEERLPTRRHRASKRKRRDGAKRLRR